jgi:hypothetical protein
MNEESALTNTQENQGRLGVVVSHPEWLHFVGAKPGLWVDVPTQSIHFIADGQSMAQFPCSTALLGTGQEEGSHKTPLGWHEIVDKVGEDAAWGQAFRGRKPVDLIWHRDQDTDDDLILTRILVLGGLEPGFNQGGSVDTRSRYIYFHGTNWEKHIGTAVSHGCIRMRNDDMITLFEMSSVGTRVWITEWM